MTFQGTLMQPITMRYLLSKTLQWSAIGFIFLSIGSTQAENLKDFKHLIGTWQSPDGSAKMSFEAEMDGSWLTSKTWFKKKNNWSLVGYGGVYHNPTNNKYLIKSRTRDMNGLVMFESEITPNGEGYHLITTAYWEDGKAMKTEEEWHIPDENTFTYTIYELKDGTKKTFMNGSWIRMK